MFEAGGKVIVVARVGDGIGDSSRDGDAVLSRLVAQLLTVTSSTTSAHASVGIGDCCTNDIWADGTELAKVVTLVAVPSALTDEAMG